MAVRAVKAVVVCWGRQCDGDMLRLLFPLLFDFNWREEQGGFGDRCCGPVRLLSLRQSSDRGRSCGGRRKVAVSLGGRGFVVEAMCCRGHGAGIKVQRRWG